MRKRSLCACLLVLVLTSLWVGACSKPAPLPPARSIVPAVPPTVVAQSDPAAVSKAVQQLRQDFATEQQHLAETSKPADAARRTWFLLERKYVSMGSKKFIPLAAIITQSYQQALPHLWNLYAINQLALTMESDDLHDVFVKNNVWLDEMREQAGLYLRDAFRVSQGWYAKKTPTSVRLAEEQQRTFLRTIEWQTMDNLHAQAEQNVRTLLVLFERHNMCRAPEVNTQVQTTQAGYIALQNALLSARYMIHLSLFFYRGIPSGKLPADALQRDIRNNNRIDALLEQAHVGQALAQGALRIADAGVCRKALQVLQKRKDNVDQKVTGLAPFEAK